jgi:hypothetical protein
MWRGERRKDIRYYNHKETQHFTRTITDNDEESSRLPIAPTAPTGTHVARGHKGLKRHTVILQEVSMSALSSTLGLSVAGAQLHFWDMIVVHDAEAKKLYCWKIYDKIGYFEENIHAAIRKSLSVDGQWVALTTDHWTSIAQAKLLWYECTLD